MKYMICVTMEFSKEIEADSFEEACQMAGDIDFDWEDCYDQRTSEIWAVDE